MGRSSRNVTSIDAGSFNALYEQFLPLNLRLKEIVGKWQLAPEEEKGPEGFAKVADALHQLQADLRPIIDGTAAHLARLGGYGDRFERALEATKAGDESMLASPIKDSYHTVWFEFHEELIVLSGRDRATEEQQHG